MQSGSTKERLQLVDTYLQSSGHCPVHQQDSIMRHLVLESKLSSLSEAGGHQLWPPLQVGQGHMLQGQTVRLLKMLHCGECIAAAPLHGRLFAEVEVVHGAVAERIHMVQASALRDNTSVINGWMWFMEEEEEKMEEEEKKWRTKEEEKRAICSCPKAHTKACYGLCRFLQHSVTLITTRQVSSTQNMSRETQEYIAGLQCR